MQAERSVADQIRQIRQIRKELGLTLQALADAMGVKLQRVKHLSSGKVQELNRGETRALVEKVGVSPRWLLTGAGPLLETAVISDGTGLSQREAALLENYRQCSETGKTVIDLSSREMAISAKGQGEKS